MGNACCADETVDKNETTVELRKNKNLTDERAPHDVGKKFQRTDMPAPATLRAETPEPPAPAGPGPGTEFKMVIYKTAGKKLGVDIDHEDDVTLLVVALTAADGLFQQWNDNYPHLNVKPGDRIIEVNGVSKEAMKMVDELRKDSLHELVVKRGP